MMCLRDRARAIAKGEATADGLSGTRIGRMTILNFWAARLVWCNRLSLSYVTENPLCTM